MICVTVWKVSAAPEDDSETSLRKKAPYPNLATCSCLFFSPLDISSTLACWPWWPAVCSWYSPASLLLSLKATSLPEQMPRLLKPIKPAPYTFSIAPHNLQLAEKRTKYLLIFTAELQGVGGDYEIWQQISALPWHVRRCVRQVASLPTFIIIHAWIIQWQLLA